MRLNGQKIFQSLFMIDLNSKIKRLKEIVQAYNEGMEILSKEVYTAAIRVEIQRIKKKFINEVTQIVKGL